MSMIAKLSNRLCIRALYVFVSIALRCMKPGAMCIMCTRDTIRRCNVAASRVMIVISPLQSEQKQKNGSICIPIIHEENFTNTAPLPIRLRYQPGSATNQALLPTRLRYQPGSATKTINKNDNYKTENPTPTKKNTATTSVQKRTNNRGEQRENKER